MENIKRNILQKLLKACTVIVILKQTTHHFQNIFRNAILYLFDHSLVTLSPIRANVKLLCPNSQENRNVRYETTTVFIGQSD